ncbi:hypothetical protein ACQ4LE_008789 [Meloidogyne hapla]
MRTKESRQRSKSPAVVRKAHEVVEFVSVSPEALVLSATGDSEFLRITNDHPNVRYCFKMKSSDNEKIRCRPVYGFVERGGAAKVEVLRIPGSKLRDDRLEILFLRTEETTDPSAPFAAAPSPARVLDVPLFNK